MIEIFTCPWGCHAHIHGLIHDGQLWACPSCLLGLMYVYRVNVCSQVTICYQVVRVSTCWWLYKPSPSLLFLVFLEFLCQEEFLRNQDNIFRCSRQPLHDHCLHTLRVSFFLCNSIHENFISTSSCALYIYVRASLFWLISFYL